MPLLAGKIRGEPSLAKQGGNPPAEAPLGVVKTAPQAPDCASACLCLARCSNNQNGANRKPQCPEKILPEASGGPAGLTSKYQKMGPRTKILRLILRSIASNRAGSDARAVVPPSGQPLSGRPTPLVWRGFGGEMALPPFCLRSAGGHFCSHTTTRTRPTQNTTQHRADQ